MKVDFYISSLSSGGAEHVLTNLAANFAEHDMDVSITSYEKRPHKGCSSRREDQRLN